MTETTNYDFLFSDPAADVAGGASSFDWVFAAPAETDHMPPDRLMLTRDAKHEFRRATGRGLAIDHLGGRPEPGKVYHLVSGCSQYELWDFTGALLQLFAPAVIDEFLASSWCCSRRIARELLAMYDAGQIRAVKMLVGTYMKRREPIMFNTLYEGLTTRGQKFRAARVHAKLISCQFSDGNFATVETSANLAENQNAEQYVISNDAGLHAFHRQWISDILEAK